MTSFQQALAQNHTPLVRGPVETLQINVGLKCNLACKHCHLEAGPQRGELMSRETMEQVLDYARRVEFATIDITGGSPELNPWLPFLVENAAKLAPRLLLRSNLTLLTDGSRGRLLDLLRSLNVALIVSFPALNPGPVEAQRGAGTFESCLEGLGLLNSLGWGVEGQDLELDLVANPAGAFLPPSQAATEQRFRREMASRWGLSFSNLFTLANVPLGRFRAWLEGSGNYEGYLQKLADGFNPFTVPGLMCRNQVSVSWDGYLYDCDFNQAAGLPMSGEKLHVSRMPGPPDAALPIQVSEYCYACTAGAGFTCGGSIEN
ncbi:MAG: arsenosugar biosynthesis radical SAM protein ArsS [Proteobacteria bacterium]|nr:arsenosugar biosynthesis radical SAM protein ArsS [Pseudomonadota bacterium]MBU1452172.1 arsenosugar biosynthesis radical SAM protein ArsS [Pseudomonadota bacterium]MBU2469976.1 arsenosugar biosynthesis radical SAM protein ArsS [Pseudomonadota bacterium]